MKVDEEKNSVILAFFKLVFYSLIFCNFVNIAHKIRIYFLYRNISWAIFGSSCEENTRDKLRWKRNQVVNFVLKKFVGSKFSIILSIFFLCRSIVYRLTRHCLMSHHTWSGLLSVMIFWSRSWISLSSTY